MQCFPDNFCKSIGKFKQSIDKIPRNFPVDSQNKSDLKKVQNGAMDSHDLP